LTDRVASPLEVRALRYIREEIPDLEAHLLGTRDFALEINRNQSLGIDEEKVVLASLCHDLARHVAPDEIAAALSQRGIDCDSPGFTSPILLHGFLSAELAKEKIGVRDEEVLDAVRWHATGRADMGLLERLLYVADKIEDNRDWPGVDDLRRLVEEDFHSAFPRVVASVISYVVAELWPLDYNSVAAYNRALADASDDPGI